MKRNSKTCLSCAFSSASGERKHRVGSDFLRDEIYRCFQKYPETTHRKWWLT